MVLLWLMIFWHGIGLRLSQDNLCFKRFDQSFAVPLFRFGFIFDTRHQVSPCIISTPDIGTNQAGVIDFDFTRYGSRDDVYNTKYYCCQNYERGSDGQCIECKKGYTSDQGKPCKRCPPNTYGPLCGGICHCRIHQSCNHIYGCLSDSVTFRSDNEDSTLMLTDANRTTSNEVMEQTRKQNIVIYVICSASVSLILILFLSILMHHRHQRRRDITRQGRREHVMKESPVISLEQYETFVW